MGIYGLTCYLKCRFRSTYMKKAPKFSQWAFFSYVVAEKFIKGPYPNKHSRPCKNSWLHAWSTNMTFQFSGRDNFWVLDQLNHSLFQLFHSLKAVYFRAYFFIHIMPRISIHRFTSIQAQMYIFICYLD